MFSRLCIFMMISLTMTACGSMNAVGSAVQSASNRVNEALDDVYSAVSSQPFQLGVRKNPCGCDASLEYEVDLGGQWRHVFLEDCPELAEFRSEAQQYEEGEVFNFYFDDTQEIYVSPHGQKFYILRPVVLKQ
ncbi:MAG: hypothetical protein J6A01_00855 [Proteobacteria bacterium]|nr:hypothetical protein [Pseudomonadota bacterium]